MISPDSESKQTTPTAAWRERLALLALLLVVLWGLLLVGLYSYWPTTTVQWALFLILAPLAALALEGLGLWLWPRLDSALGANRDPGPHVSALRLLALLAVLLPLFSANVLMAMWWRGAL